MLQRITGLLPNQHQFGEIFDTSPTTGTAARDGATAAQALLNGLTPTSLAGVEIGGRTIGGTGTVTLDAGGDPNAIFVFRAASTLITASASRVVLVKDAQACNVFWQVSSSATFGTRPSSPGR